MFDREDGIDNLNLAIVQRLRHADRQYDPDVEQHLVQFGQRGQGCQEALRGVGGRHDDNERSSQQWDLSARDRKSVV